MDFLKTPTIIQNGEKIIHCR